MRSRRGLESASVVVGLLLIALIVGAFYISIFPKRILSGANTMDKEREKAGAAVEPSFIDTLFSKLGGSSCGGTYTKTVTKADGTEEIKSTCKESMCEQTPDCVCIETGTDMGKCVERTPSPSITTGTCSGIKGRCMNPTECTGDYKSESAGTLDCKNGLECCKTCASNVVDATKNLRAVCRSSCPADKQYSKTYGCNYGMKADSYLCCKTTG